MPTPLPPTPYNTITLLELRSRLAAKLGDIGNAFWVSAELTDLLNESIQTFQAWSGFYTQRVTIPLVSNQTIYELPEVVPELQYTTTVAGLVQQIRRVLLETDAMYPGYTSQLDTPQPSIEWAVRVAYENFLAATHLIQQWFDVAIPAPGDGLVEFPNTKLQINQLYWGNIPATPAIPKVYTQLHTTDVDNTQGYTHYASAATTPKSYVQYTQPANYIRLFPSPSDLGRLVGWMTNNLTPASLLSNPIPIPDSLAWVLKYSALEYLFSLDGQSRDLIPRRHCD